MKLKFLFVSLTITVLSLSGLFYLGIETKIFHPYVMIPQSAAPITGSIETKSVATKKEVVDPPPLKVLNEIQGAILSRQGIVSFTNKQRLGNGLTSLKENPLLNMAAEAKTKDMFDNQYFGHQSPSGLDAGGFVEGAGYSFIMVGENLAEGNFENDEVLVQAWMDSPGHRANILQNKFTEIGVSVKKGLWNGRLTWMAVQEFALPLSACPQSDKSLAYTIETNRSKIDTLSLSLEEKKGEIDAVGGILFLEYKRKVNEYNNLVLEYNTLVEETKVLVNFYNSQVNAFNDCIK